MNTSQLKKLRKDCIEKARDLAKSKHSERIEDVPLLLKVYEHFRQPEDLKAVQLLIAPLVKEKRWYRFEYTRQLASVTREKSDIKASCEAARDKVRWLVDHRDDDGFADQSTIVKATAIQDLAEEYSRYGFLEEAYNLMSESPGGYTSEYGAYQSYKRFSVLLGIWKITKNKRNLGIIKSLAGTNPDQELRNEAICLIAETTRRGEDVHAGASLMEQNKSKLEATLLRLRLALVDPRSVNLGWLWTETELLKNQNILDARAKLQIMEKDWDEALKTIPKLDPKVRYARTKDIIGALAKDNKWKRAGEIQEEFSLDAWRNREFVSNYSIARESELSLAEAYAKVGDFKKCFDLLGTSKGGSQEAYVNLYITIAESAQHLIKGVRKKPSKEW